MADCTSLEGSVAAAHPPLVSHPRRPPAHKSMSLVHSRDQTPALGQQSMNNGKDRTKTHSPPSSDEPTSDVPVLSSHGRSSGESSNAEKWFEKSNNNAKTGSAGLIGNNDPPFFLRNASSTETTPDVVKREQQRQTALALLYNRSHPFPLDNADSSSEDFRSVIDDLTVQNKKLKRKLKKYERSHNRHLQDDKLFEIRIHGLAPDKKRELEETLHKFALTLNAPSAQQKLPSAGTSSEQSFAPPTFQTKFSVSDSAYASASGQMSSAPSGQGSNGNTKHKPTDAGIAKSQQMGIQAYLSDIPLGLMPRTVVMTENAKQKLVVRRLEQLFAGKGASKTGHQQPLQQQEISRSATQAENSALEASGGQVSREGAREARIMIPSTDPAAAGDAATKPDTLMTDDMDESAAPDIESKDFGIDTSEPSPDQRPTRPLDLDPFRAQVPSENIKYLQHLGFSPLEVDSKEELVDGHGYSYLNILINLAQLHTLNVTPEFVKKSVELYSQKLELSADGRKVRWKGGNELTRTNSNGSPQEASNALNPPFAPGNASGLDSSESTSKMVASQDNKTAYKPIFFRQSQDDEMSDSDMSEWSNPGDDPAADSSGFTSSGMRTISSKKRQAHDGPIIFYNRAPFVTDLSGDYRAPGARKLPPKPYSSLSAIPSRVARIASSIETQTTSDSKGPLSRDLHAVNDALETASLSASTPDSLHGFSKPASLKTSSGSSSEENPVPIEFEASGLGGVQPSDNFSINVKSRHKLIREHSTYAGPNSRSRTYPPRIRALLAESAPPSSSSSKAAQNRAVESEIIASNHRDLPASELPPPSYFPLDSPEEEDSESDDSEDYESDDEEEQDGMVATILHERRVHAAKAAQIPRWSPEDECESDSAMSTGAEASDAEDDDGDDDSDDTSSVDMLAHARKIAPEVVHVAEREYDTAMAERLADEIPAGSSAATAGGGSGFNSPASPMAAPSTTHQGAEIARGLKRARTGVGNEREHIQAGGRKSKSPKLSV